MLFETPNGPTEITPDHLFIAGWTGRDQAAVTHHIEELAALGVAPPSQTPLFYRTSRSLLTQSTDIEVLGPHTSGEAEPLLIQHKGQLWLGLGSDHTDRDLETVSVAASKQACPKPVAPVLWPFEAVAFHLDDLALKSWIYEGDSWTLYQDGTLANILPLDTLMGAADLPDNAAMLCGTLGAIGGVRPSERFKCEMFDPHSKMRIELDYVAKVLPSVS